MLGWLDGHCLVPPLSGCSANCQQLLKSLWQPVSRLKIGIILPAGPLAELIEIARLQHGAQSLTDIREIIVPNDLAELIVSVDFITKQKLMTCMLDSQAALVKLSNPFVRWSSPNRLMIPLPISRWLAACGARAAWYR